MKDKPGGMCLQDPIFLCGCKVCGHTSRNDCVEHKCHCCDLEDAFSLLTHLDARRALK